LLVENCEGWVCGGLVGGEVGADLFGGGFDVGHASGRLMASGTEVGI